MGTLWGENTRVDKIPVLRSVHFVGNVRLDNRALADAMGLRQGKPLPPDWPEACLRRLLDWAHGIGYFFARIDSAGVRFTSDSAAVMPTIWIDEGPRVLLGDLKLDVPEGIPAGALLDLIESRSGRPFVEQVLLNDVEEMLITLENRGFPLASVELVSLEIRTHPEDPKIDIRLHIDTGPEVVLDSVIVQGNEITKTQLIIRESRLRTGSMYRHKTIMTVRERLMKLGYFDDVEEPEVHFLRDRAIVGLRIKDGNTNTFDGVVGYTPSNDERRSGYVTGRLQFLFPNLFGTGRLLEAYWEKKDETSQAMRFAYEEPWLFGIPLRAGARFQQEIRDTSYVERTWRMYGRYDPWPAFSVHAEAGHRHVIPDSLGLEIYDLARTSEWLVSFGLNYGTLDDALNPRRGVSYSTRITVGRKRNFEDSTSTPEEGDTRVNTRRIEADAEAVIPLFRNHLAYIGLHGIEVKTGDAFIPISDQVRFGGARTLRGYAEDAFRGSVAAWFNLEYRVLFGRKSRLFLFVDGGLFQRREKTQGLVRGLKIGYGFGMRLDTRVGLFGIDFGLGEGDRLLQAKVHVGLVNRF